MKNFKTVNFEKTTPTTAKNLARSAMVDFIKNVMIEVFGEDNVSIVGASEISIAIGERKDSDGFLREVCVNIAPVAKEVEDRATTKNVFEAYDRLLEAESYAKTINEKEEEKKKKEEAKEKAKKKLEEAKAKKEAEKKKRIAEKISAKNVDESESEEEEVKTVDESESEEEEVKTVDESESEEEEN